MHSPHLTGALGHDWPFLLGSAAVLLGVRIAADLLVLPRMREFLKRRSAVPSEQRDHVAGKVLDLCFSAVLMTALLAWAWHTMLTNEPGCTPWRTSECLAGWPHHRVPQAFRWVWLTLCGWYLHEMAGTALGIGHQLPPQAVVHHVITLSLMAAAYCCDFHRMGLLVVCMFDLSNPLMDVAKGLDMANLQGSAPEAVKVASFVAFAGVFFAMRVARPPAAFLLPWWRNPAGVPAGIWWFGTVCLGVLYSMNCVWFGRIASILGGHFCPRVMGGKAQQSSAPAVAASQLLQPGEEAGEGADDVRAPGGRDQVAGVVVAAVSLRAQKQAPCIKSA